MTPTLLELSTAVDGWLSVAWIDFGELLSVGNNHGWPGHASWHASDALMAIVVTYNALVALDVLSFVASLWLVVGDFNMVGDVKTREEALGVLPIFPLELQA
eukprot:Gb_30099 [translate_table: standard]